VNTYKQKIHNKPGAGKNRDYWAIKRWFDNSNYSIGSVAQEVGVHRSIVGQTIRGIRNSRKVLRRLVEIGCPQDFLGLPADVKQGGTEGDR
jgi:hypothetical protein